MVSPDQQDEVENVHESLGRADVAPDAAASADSEDSTLGLSRRGMLVGGGLLGLFGLGMGSASADASGQIGTANDPLGKLFVNEIDGAVVDQDGGADIALTSFVGADLTIDANGNLSTTAGPDQITVNSNNTIIQENNQNEVFNDASNAVVLGISNEIDADGAVAIGGTNNAFVAADLGAVKIGGTAGTMEATGEGSVILAGAGTSHVASGTGSVILGGWSGSYNAAGSGSVVAGQSTSAEAANSFVIGANCSSKTTAAESFVGGREGEAGGRASFVWAGNNSGNNTISDSDVDGKVIFNADGGFEILADDSSPDPLLDVKGKIQTTEAVATSSSARYKQNIRPFNSADSEVLDIHPKLYELKETGETDVGLIAEEVHEILPEIVYYNDNQQPEGIHYSRVGMFLAPEVSENRDRIEAVEATRDACETMIDELEADLSAKDARIADQADRIDQLESENTQLAERFNRLEGQLNAGVAVTGTPPADD